MLHPEKSPTRCTCLITEKSYWSKEWIAPRRIFGAWSLHLASGNVDWRLLLLWLWLKAERHNVQQQIFPCLFALLLLNTDLRVSWEQKVPKTMGMFWQGLRVVQINSWYSHQTDKEPHWEKSSEISMYRICASHISSGCLRRTIHAKISKVQAIIWISWKFLMSFFPKSPKNLSCHEVRVNSNSPSQVTNLNVLPKTEQEEGRAVP